MGSLRRIGDRGQTLPTYVFKGWVSPIEGQDQMEEDKLRDYCNQIVCLIALLGCLKGVSNLTKDTCLPHPHKNPSWLSSIVLYLSEWFYNPLSCSRRNLLIILDSLQFPTPQTSSSQNPIDFYLILHFLVFVSLSILIFQATIMSSLNYYNSLPVVFLSHWHLLVYSLQGI